MTHEPPPAEVTIKEITDRLAERFPTASAATIHEVVAATYEEYSDAHVRDFVEVLVEKQAKNHLEQLDS